MPVAPAVDVSVESRTSDRLSHVVLDRERVRRAIVERTPVEALCGKVWVPSRWKPEGVLRCRVCDELARNMYWTGPR